MAFVSTTQTKQLITSILQPWQLRYFRAFQVENRMISLCSRQIGKSFIAAFCAVYDCVLNGATWTLVSTGQRAADELFRKCVKMARYFEATTRGTRLHFTFSNNASEIRFSNGASICSCPNNPDGLRGKSSSLLFDEMAFIENADECFQACIPFLTSPYGAEKKLQIISTPGGCSGKFYELWNGSDYYRTKVTLLDAVKEGLAVDVDEIRRTIIDDDIWRQEYMVEFLDTNTALFSFELLRGSVYDVLPSGGKVWLGVDIGRTHDRTSIAILREVGGVLYVDRVESLSNREFDFQFQYISNLTKSLKPVRVCIDATGIGAQLAEQLHKRFPCVHEVKFSNESKNEMFNLTKRHLGSSTLKLPNDEGLIEDLHKIRRIVSPSGNISYGASRDDSGHADEATAVALAVYAAKRQQNIFMPMSMSGK